MNSSPTPAGSADPANAPAAHLDGWSDLLSGRHLAIVLVMASGVLLYAGTDEEIQPDCEYIISGNRIAAKTLNLNSNWQDICEQLDSLAETYL